MDIKITEVTLENFDDVVDLELLKEQEEYVADNTYSIAESKYYRSYQPRAIYYNDTVVGFLMYESMDAEGKPDEYDIFRLMIDRRFQHKGIGRQAMQLALKEIRQQKPIKRITVCYVTKNPVAKDFYASLGFEEVGLNDDNEMVAEIRL